MKSLAFLIGVSFVLPAWAAPDPAASKSSKPGAVKVEAVPNSTVKKVTLTPKAHERLGIEMGKVEETSLARRQVVGGLTIMPDSVPVEDPASAGGTGRSGGFGGFIRPQPQKTSHGPKPGAGETWIQVSLSHAEYEQILKDQPARVRPLATRAQLAKEVNAVPAGLPPLEDPKRSMLTVFYKVNGADHGLKPNTRMRVELPQTGSNGKHKVAPYGALYYDAKGAPWVYVSPAPLSFQRVPVKVDRIIGDHAVLSEGPPVGTEVVKVGAALLFGAEVFGK
ncbi:MAG TPA: hypothetical protein VD965_08190 [Burkholderiales bacterium]|nr:hypothetical protein [Burkholderiales bacterium]